MDNTDCLWSKETNAWHQLAGCCWLCNSTDFRLGSFLNHGIQYRKSKERITVEIFAEKVSATKKFCLLDIRRNMNRACLSFPLIWRHPHAGVAPGELFFVCAVFTTSVPGRLYYHLPGIALLSRRFNKRKVLQQNSFPDDRTTIAVFNLNSPRGALLIVLVLVLAS
jgi:hypothetical protein